MERIRCRSRFRPALEPLEDRRLLTVNPPVSIPAIAHGLTHSPLYDAKIVTLAYQNFLGRFPEPAGLDAWVTALQAGISDEQMEAGILQSPEYLSKHGGGTQGWIRGLYVDLLGRLPADAEIQLWLGSIAQGASSAQVAYAFAISTEREADLIVADYQRYLDRPPEPGALSVWIQALAHGASNQDIVTGFLASPEYVEKEGGDYTGWYSSALQDAYGGVPVQDSWFQQHIDDRSLRITIELASLDGQLDWSDLIAIFREVELEGSIAAARLQDLQQLVLAGRNPEQITLNGQPVTMPPVVSNLVSKVIGDNPANAFFQGMPLGDLQAGSNPDQLEELVDKWFLGLDHPIAAASYSPVAGTLFGSAGPVYTDLRQGIINDCYLLAGFADVAARMPGTIQSLFTYLGTGVNGSSVWAVRLDLGGQPDYVTVDNLLSQGGWLYDRPTNPVADGDGYGWTLWAPLLEKAFAQEFGNDDYANLDASSQPAALALAAITGRSTGWVSMDAGSLAAQLRQGALLFIGTGDSPASPNLVPDHCYVVVNYDPTSPQPFTLFNPWGVNSGPFAFQFNVDAAFLNRNFRYFWTTG
jgi:hypothetical protein